ncbi:hypothetical protein B0H66DRAFT_558339 [Apodospora peruviana]|uniref:Uncharacterized protein n=1 Tax=Apodospora peruviana TaxID=516989 RepID=A0AAE0I5D7_9PEZI|nr:hypothetical protein B0H66DRAFT_558339 [Apodospora peruviana]
MKEPQLSNFPINTSPSFCPTKIFLIHEPNTDQLLAPIAAETSDITASPAAAEILATDTTNEDVHDLLPEPVLSRLEPAAADQHPFLKVASTSWYKRALKAILIHGSTEEEKEIAQLAGPLLSLGRWKFIFADATYSSHKIEMRPTGVGSRADVFVKDSLLFFWEPVAHGQRARYVLWKGTAGEEESRQREVVGVYALVAHHGHGHWHGESGKKRKGRRGVLVVDDSKVDKVVAVLTCVATVNRVESFR